MFIVLIPIFGLMGFNYYVDPYWNFKHAHANNDYQNGFDERLQKTNLLVGQKQPFDSLLIGSSRVTYMNTNNFKQEEVFNYGLSALHIDEYKDYIAFTRNINDGELQRIYVELYMDSYNDEVKRPMAAPDFYFEEAQNRLLDYTSLFSKDALDKTLLNYRASKENKFHLQRSYTRDNQVRTTYPNNRLPILRENFKKQFEETKYTDEFPYDPDYKKKLGEMKHDNPDSEFVIFTDFAPADRLKMYLKNPNYFEAYDQWFHEMVDVFGEVRSFHMQNEYTQADKYWLDWFHFYPEVGDKMIHSLETREGEGSLYLLVNEDNVDQYLVDLKKWVNE